VDVQVMYDLFRKIRIKGTFQMKNKSVVIVLSLAVALGVSLGQIEKLFFTSPQVEYGEFSKYGVTNKNHIKIYGSGWCPFCDKLKDFLSANNIVFSFIDVESDLNGKSEFIELNGDSYPLMLIGNTLIRGFNETLIRNEFAKLDVELNKS
jgi:glutaredoxin